MVQSGLVPASPLNCGAGQNTVPDLRCAQIPNHRPENFLVLLLHPLAGSESGSDYIIEYLNENKKPQIQEHCFLTKESKYSERFLSAWSCDPDFSEREY